LRDCSDGEQRESDRRSVTPSHAVIEIKDVRFDLVARIIARKMRHFQQLNNAARVAVAPINELMQDMIEI
jgi:hypothetical protein